MLTHFETIFNQRYSQDSIGLRTSREMRTLAKVLDALLEGNVGLVGDLLIQRRVGEPDQPE